MSGTSEGARKAAEKNKKFYGADFYKHIGKLGGQKSRGGFGTDTIGRDGLTGLQRASKAGKVGGKKSRRTKLDVKFDERVESYVSDEN